MSWPEAIVGSVGALVGVGLGSWISGRSDATLAARAQLDAQKREIEKACTEVGAAFRAMGRFVRSEEMTVELVERPEDHRTTEVIRNARPPWAAVDQALAGLEILVSAENEVWLAAQDLREVLKSVIRSRANYRAGAIPNAVYGPYRDCQIRFARAAREHLDAMK